MCVLLLWQRMNESVCKVLSKYDNQEKQQNKQTSKQNVLFGMCSAYLREKKKKLNRQKEEKTHKLCEFGSRA